MSSFTTPLVVRKMPDGKRWRLVNSFTYRIGDKDSKDKIVVHNGFVTDFASVPRFLWWLIPPRGKYGKAAVLHDWLYQHHSFSCGDILYTVTREKADKIFLEAMGVLSVRKWRKYPMYLAVRLFGKLAWRKK